MENTSGQEKYYLGLDMGTSSVGWAVTDDQYEIIKKHGKALWGIRLFEQANTAEGRRAFRTARRRTERRKNRIALLQELFSEEIAKIDPGFFLRMKESKYVPEDKRDVEGNMPELPYTLFVDHGFTDVEFHKQFPTIYHLRYALIAQMDKKPDIRLVYLALHHIMKHRGHFLFEGKGISEGTNFSVAVQALLDCLEENGVELSELQQEDQMQQLEQILTSSDSSRTEKKKLLCALFAGKDKQKKALAGLIAGCTVKLSDLFDDRALDEEDRNKISFSDGKVIGVEIVEEAVEAARINAARNGLDNCEFIAGDVLKVIYEMEEKPDVIVLDPPREGVHPKALRRILAYGVEQIVYISCKPTSLAREMEVFLEHGYRPVKAVCVDLFPWTRGVETVVMFSHKRN